MRTSRWGVLTVALLALMSLSANADSLKVELDDWFGNGGNPDLVPPQGDTPWLVACFEDMGSYVKLTMSASGLIDDEFVSDWLFNFNPAKEVEDLHFAFVSGIAADDPISTGEDAFKADGDGYYDIEFAFPTSGSRFEGGLTSVYNITLDGGGLTAADFAFIESGHKDDKGTGPHYSAAHVQSIGAAPGTSAWIGATGTGTCDPVPEPASMTLLGLGLVGLALRRRSRKA